MHIIDFEEKKSSLEEPKSYTWSVDNSVLCFTFMIPVGSILGKGYRLRVHPR